MQFQIECIESKSEPNQTQYSKFVLEPLDRGQGTTIGNALRRVLLSNLEGTSITAVRIAGLVRSENIRGEKGETRFTTVNHEFATLVGGLSPVSKKGLSHGDDFRDHSDRKRLR